MNELEHLQRAYDAIDEPTREAAAAARGRLLAEIASGDRAGSAWNGRAQLARSRRRRRRRLVAVAVVLLVGAVLVVPAFGVGSRILELLESPRTHPPAEVGAPVWSPDGQKIAFQI